MTTIYLPTLGAGPKPVVQPEESTPEESMPAGDFARALFRLMRDDTGQQRRKVVAHDRLIGAAQYRADDMVRRGYYSHTDPDGVGPNATVRRFGYALPDHYHSELDANNVESIASEAADPASLWALFLKSAPHRAHLLGENTFYAAQVNVGIGVAVQPSGRYMVSVISAPAEA